MLITVHAEEGFEMAQDGTLADVGEFGLIARLTDGLPSGEAVLVGPGDDAAVIRADSGSVVASVDVFVEHVHFRRDWSTAVDIGRKAAAASMADIAAMGARPTALVVGFVAPVELPASWAVQCTAGLVAEAERFGAALVGGDVAAGPHIMLSVTALGELIGADPVLRGGARSGDVIAVAGRLGWSAAGLAALSRGFRSPKALVDAHRCPQPPIEAALRAAVAGATAMIDVSDGLVADARHIAEASGAVLALDSALVPVDEAVASAAAAFSVDPRTWTMTGGEDHAFLATFPPEVEVPQGFVVIGTVRAVEADGAGVVVDGARVASGGGHDHFRVR